MVTLLISVLIISAIAAALALLLVIAEYFFANYGECTVTINKEKKIKVEGGASLLSTLSSQKIFIPSACGGKGTCGLCKLKVLDGAGPLLPTEEPFLDKDEIKANVRMACQVKVRQDLKIEIPEELFNIKEYNCKCEEIRDLTHDMKLFRFKLVEPSEVKYIPGQYMQFQAPEYEKSKEEVYRAYSIASDPAKKDIIDFVIRLVPGGICTTYCFNYLKKGDDAKMNGPYGHFKLTDTDKEMVWIAGGSGIAPFISILYQMKNTNNQRKATFYFGANQVKELALVDEMKQFEKDLPNFKFVPVISRPEENESWDGEKGLVIDAVTRNNKDLSNAEGYLCGSPGLIDASVKTLTGLGMEEEKIFYDKFA
ncbi:MAG: 2Fe-2S iron-sulfur cluster binding domain-containing protein [Sedimentisphaerales bacterium]|nr:2Fe-2S iron-sulfur cluster binding domain-containing protein [Sedimentisphaerales bacterium]